MTDMISKLSDPEQPATTLTSVRVKTPRRILHFSDGTLEEYSTDEDEADEAQNECKCVEKPLGSMSVFDNALMVGYKVLGACDFVGEKIAGMLGITSPKYSYEIEQFKKIEEERKKTQEEEKSMGGWMQETANVRSESLEMKNNNGPQPIISQHGLQKF